MTSKVVITFRDRLHRLAASRVAVYVLWLAVGVVIPYMRFVHGKYDNYIIFRRAFEHLVHQQNLYADYPGQQADVYLYGPTAAALMAPFALLPDWAGCLLFLVVSVTFLFAAIHTLPLSITQRNIICLLCVVDMGNNHEHFQTNALMAGLIIFAFALIMRHRNITAAACVAIGAITKLYGIIALPFVLFGKQKTRFVIAIALGAAVLFVIPMLFSSPTFVWNSYGQWLERLAAKNQANVTHGGFQNKSIYHLMAGLFGSERLPQWPILLAGGLIFAYPFVHCIKHYTRQFAYLSLAWALMFVVLFSSSSENPTYIILQCGAAAWCVAGSGLPVKTRGWLMAMVIVFSSLTPLDVFPKFVRQFFDDYALRVLPCLAIWVIVFIEMLRCKGQADSEC